ncbi:hypothetical protein ColTof3_13125 [Colletotrichum tofieldiae]|nr:hypothetical protein ColTof3_13125 [Colletotrichum tofieldiae]
MALLPADATESGRTQRTVQDGPAVAGQASDGGYAWRGKQRPGYQRYGRCPVREVLYFEFFTPPTGLQRRRGSDAIGRGRVAPMWPASFTLGTCEVCASVSGVGGT